MKAQARKLGRSRGPAKATKRTKRRVQRSAAVKTRKSSRPVGTRRGKTVKRRRQPGRKINKAASAYNKSFDQAYNEGYNAGFAKGFEDGHQLAYEQQP